MMREKNREKWIEAERKGEEGEEGERRRERKRERERKRREERGTCIGNKGSGSSAMLF